MKIMSKQRVFNVLLFGLTQYEQQVINRIFSLTRYRTRRYQMITNLKLNKAHIAIVDTMHMLEFERLSTASSNETLPRLILDSLTHKTAIKSDLVRPLNSKSLISKLDQLTIKDYQFVPELVINDVQQSDKLDRLLHNIVNSIPKNNARVLVVDDSPSARTKMSLELELFGINVEEMSHGHDALVRIPKGRYDIIFLDVSLGDGDLDGFSLCKKIKADALTKRIPVCMMTGKTSPINKVKGAIAGCDAYLTKPVDAEKLKSVLKQYVFDQKGGNRQTYQSESK